MLVEYCAMDVTSILDKLNAAQEEAVTSDKQHLLVLAGAGSGKTRVLVHRIAWKLQVDNLSPYSILAVTFTNKAAREMKTRIASIVGDSEAKNLWMGTFHSVFAKILRKSRFCSNQRNLSGRRYSSHTNEESLDFGDHQFDSAVVFSAFSQWYGIAVTFKSHPGFGYFFKDKV